MSHYDCDSKYCFFYGKGRYFCNCRRADKNGSATFVQECRANRKLKEDSDEKSIRTSG